MSRTAPRLLNELDSELGKQEDLTCYDLFYWENLRSDEWVKVFSSKLIGGWEYIKWSMWRPTVKFLEFKFKRNDKITTIRINYREGFHWKWSEFVDIVNQKLQEEN